MATTSTKSIAARLPFDEYVRVVKQASDAKLTVSDYLILKLSASDRVAQAEAQQVALIQQVRQLKKEIQDQADLAFEQERQADAKQIDLRREMTQLQKQADANQQNLQTALGKERVELEKIRKYAGEWQSYATNLDQAKTVLEQTIKTQEQTLARQLDELAQLKAKNGLLTSENQKLHQESSVVKTELATLKEQGISLWNNLVALHNDHLFGKMHDRYWVLLDEFNESLKAMP